MAVVFMKKLEEEPDTYDHEFSKLLKGDREKVHKWILEKLQSGQSILEVGCGPGQLAIKIAKIGCNIEALDANQNMIQHAKEKSSEIKNIEFNIGDAVNLTMVGQSSNDTQEKYEVIVSTFMLSELRPLEQQSFLRSAFDKLTSNGKLIVAAEFQPKGINKLIFSFKRRIYLKKLKKLKINITHPLKWFEKYFEPIGFKIIDSQTWKNGSIKALHLEKSSNTPGYYTPSPIPFRGIKAWLKEIRCLYTGQVDSVPIQPGIYKSGNPTELSPIIVTSNYIYTYIKVMRDLERGFDAWVLCVDSRGINVWCAARGGNLGNSQLLELVAATDIRQKAKSPDIILPQLCAGGMSAPSLPMKTETFPYEVVYGPAWSKDLPEYLKTLPEIKPERMKVIKFNPKHRLRAGITHTTFLFRKVYLRPILLLTLLLSLIDPPSMLWVPRDLAFIVIISNLLIASAFPLTNFTRRFLTKAHIFGTTNTILQAILFIFIRESPYHVFFLLPTFYWIGFFSTMSFSGYTFATSPREIQAEYPIFSKLNKKLRIISIISAIIGIVLIHYGVI